MRPSLGVVLCALAALAASSAAPSAAARADLDVALANGDKVTGTLSPAAEVETYRVAIPQGALLNVSLKGKKTKTRAAAVTAIALFAPDDTMVLSEPAAAAGHKVKNHEATQTGVYRIVVTGTTVGDYQLVVSWKSPAKLVVQRIGDANATDSNVFAGEAGARLAFSVKPGAGSSALVHLTRLVLVDEDLITFPPPADPMAKTHKGAYGPLPVTGSYFVDVRNVSPTETGAYVLTIGIKPPKASKRKVDLTALALGEDDGSGLAQGQIVGPFGGTVAFDLGGAVEGASVAVPPGALGFPTPILIGTAPTIVPPGSALGNSGPAVLFGPEGLKFSAPVQVTIPFDVTALGGDVGALVVYTRDAKGDLEIVPPPYLVDAVLGTITFPADHFSSFQAFARAGSSQDVNGDGIDDLVVMSPSHPSGGVLGVFRGGPQVRDEDASTLTLDDAFAVVHAGEADRQGVNFAVGDLDGDGIAEVVFAVDNVELGNGLVHIYRGGPKFARDVSRGTRTTITSPPGGPSTFGDAIAIGDLDGDGVNDLVLTASFGGPNGEGAAYLIRGTRGSLPSGSIEQFPTLVGTQILDEFGASVAIGDVNGDLRADLVIGAPHNFAGGGPGYVRVFPGGSGFFQNPGLIDPIVLSGDMTATGFGSAVVVADFEGDGLADLGVGAPARFATGVPGSVSVFRGGPGFSSRGESAADTRYSAMEGGDMFGGSLSVADFDTLMTPSRPLSFFVGAEGADDPSGPTPDTGAVHQLDISDFGAGPVLSGGASSYGAAGGNRDGFVHPALDWDGDGRRDLVVGAPGADTEGGEDAGSVRVWFAFTFPGADVQIDGKDAFGALGRR